MRNSKEIMGDWVMGLWGDYSRMASPYPPITHSPYRFLAQRCPHQMTGWRDHPITLSPYHLCSSARNLIICILIAIMLPACYEDRNGCLDLRATNFDIDADRECDNCCIYPQLKLAFEHKLQPDSNTNLTYTTAVYKDGAGNDFRVRDIQFYVSNARLVREDGSEVYPTDSLNVNIQPPGSEARAQKIGDNVALINRNNFTPAEMGRFVTTGRFTKIRFTIGLQDVLNQVIPTSLPDSLVNHPLENTAMYIKVDSGFIFNRLQLFNNTISTDTIFTTYKIVQPDSITIDLPINLNIVEGFNPKVTIRINYLTWFQGVNLKNDSPAMVATKIAANLKNSFLLTRVEMEGL